MIPSLDNPFYYLENFERVLQWIMARYADLLCAEERAFITDFAALGRESRALLVRMVMRKGDLFRASKLRYEEIGSTREAAAALAARGWIDADPVLNLEQLFALLKKGEIAAAFHFSPLQAAARKCGQLEALLNESSDFHEPRHFAAWIANADDCVYQVRITSLCERLRLMFFGNLHQDWSEFVLADLGIFKYEKVELSDSSRGFQTRGDVDRYLHLHRCRERLLLAEPQAGLELEPHAGSIEQILDDVRAGVSANPWLESRRAKLLFLIAQQFERRKDWDSALGIYRECTHPGARVRAIRMLERCEQFDAAFALLNTAEQGPHSEAENQQLLRIAPRLRRRLGLRKLAVAEPAMSGSTKLELILPAPAASVFVEEVVRVHLECAHAPVHYVENTLINSLFGLLCWNAIFSAVPGAFFHPFHQGPADLHSADFHQRRADEFNECLSQLDSHQTDSARYQRSIRNTFREKLGTQSPFVFWESLTEELLELALSCIPPLHLKRMFERILLDIKSNRSGLPDLIQFWPEERRYRMIEVKGPGDRLQDNQIRWLAYCAAHEIPAAVCYVRWAEDSL